jgi:hypothetical protein
MSNAYQADNDCSTIDFLLPTVPTLAFSPSFNSFLQKLTFFIRNSALIHIELEPTEKYFVSS